MTHHDPSRPIMTHCHLWPCLSTALAIAFFPPRESRFAAHGSRRGRPPSPTAIGQVPLLRRALPESSCTPSLEQVAALFTPFRMDHRVARHPWRASRNGKSSMSRAKRQMPRTASAARMPIMCDAAARPRTASAASLKTCQTAPTERSSRSQRGSMPKITS